MYGCMDISISMSFTVYPILKKICSVVYKIYNSSSDT